MINFPESLPFLGLASNNCTYTTSHTRKKDLLQIFFRRPSFNNNFCFIYFPLTYHTSSGFLDVHRSECMWFCFCFNLSPSCSSVFIFSPSLLVTVKVYVCCLFLLILAVLPLLFCLLLFVLFFDLLYFSAKFSIFTSDSSPYIFFFCSFIFSLILRMIHKTEKEKTIKTCS